MKNFNPMDYPKDFQPFAQNVKEELSIIQDTVDVGEGCTNIEEHLINTYHEVLLPIYKDVELATAYGDVGATDTANARFITALRELVAMILNTTRTSEVELAKTLVAKNINYGNSFDNVVDKFGIVGLLIRFADKISRLTQLSNGVDDLIGEASYDTILDIAGYSMLSLIYCKTRLVTT